MFAQSRNIGVRRISLVYAAGSLTPAGFGNSSVLSSAESTTRDISALFRIDLQPLRQFMSNRRSPISCGEN